MVIVCPVWSVFRLATSGIKYCEEFFTTGVYKHVSCWNLHFRSLMREIYIIRALYLYGVFIRVLCLYWVCWLPLRLNVFWSLGLAEMEVLILFWERLWVVYWWRTAFNLLWLLSGSSSTQLKSNFETLKRRFSSELKPNRSLDPTLLLHRMCYKVYHTDLFIQ